MAVESWKWEENVKAVLEGKDLTSTAVEVRNTAGGIYLIIPPGQEMEPDGDSDEITSGWTFNVEGSDRFERFSCLRELLDECLDDSWFTIVWPKVPGLEDADLEWTHHRHDWRLLDKEGKCYALVSKKGDYSNEYTAVARPWGLPEDTFSQEFTSQGIPTEALDMAEKVVTD